MKSQTVEKALWILSFLWVICSGGSNPIGSAKQREGQSLVPVVRKHSQTLLPWTHGSASYWNLSLGQSVQITETLASILIMTPERS